MSKFGPNDTLDAMLDEICTCTRLDVVSGGTVDVPTFDIEIADPT